MRLIVALALVASACAAATSPPPDADPHPKTVDEFKAAVQKVLDDTGVPGAGIALVRLSGVEWAGGVGLADRDARTPVTADTHFRAGSISKTFIATALVQMYEDGEIDLDAPVVELASDVRIDNAWDDRHSGAPHPSPAAHRRLRRHALQRDLQRLATRPTCRSRTCCASIRASRVVRWRPGTRMSYSNPGYAVAGYIIEKVTGEKYEDRIAEHIFKPTGMTDEQLRPDRGRRGRLAKGYRDSHRPAGSVFADLSAAVGQPAHVGRLTWASSCTCC